MSLKFFDIRCCFFENDSAFRRIVLACLRVERLELSCDGINQYAAVLADLIGNSTSNLPSLVFYGSTHDGTLGEEELSSIAASLLGNTRFKLLRMMTPVSCDSMSSIATALCNTSSIGAICNSNHTLKFIRNGRSANCYDVDCYENVPHLLVGYLNKMNALRNKHVVIHKKISRYYFIRDFDISPFSNMRISLLPIVLAMIKCITWNDRLSAIFRLLKSLPDLCSVSSREMIGRVVNTQNDVDNLYSK
eukprot:scaffold88768_cov71-Cyclotella_meneghiniana.AAC.4